MDLVVSGIIFILLFGWVLIIAENDLEAEKKAAEKKARDKFLKNLGEDLYPFFKEINK